MQKKEIANGVDEKVSAQADDVGVTAAKRGQGEDTKEHDRRADKIEGERLLFVTHGVEHTRGNHGKAHGQEDRTAFADIFPCEGVRKGERAHFFADGVEKRS